MKKFLLGLALLICGFLGIAMLIAATVMCPIIPWNYNNIEGWFAVILGMHLQIPFLLFLASAVSGLILCIIEAFQIKI